MRLLIVLLLCVAAMAAAAQHTNDVLLLIQRARASHIEADQFHPGPWVLWPEELPGRANGLLSIPTGVDWRGAEGDRRFSEVPGGWAALNWQHLKSRGDLALRTKPIALLTLGGSSSTNALVVAVSTTSEEIHRHGLSGDWPPDSLMVAEARDWNEVDAVARSTRGRVMVLEYPPAPAGASRAWLYSGQWPAGLLPVGSDGIPGLVRAREVLKLFEPDVSMEWRPRGSKENPYEWLRFNRETSPWLLGTWLVLSAGLLGWAVLLVMRERPAPFAGRLMTPLILSPAALLVAGRAAIWLGLDSLLPGWIVATAALTGVAALAALWSKRLQLDPHPLWTPMLIGLVTLAIVEPRWSPWGSAWSEAPDAAAVFMVHACGTSVLSCRLSGWGKVFRLLPLALVIVGLVERPWWLGLGLPVFLLLLMALPLAERRVGWQPYLALAMSTAVLSGLEGYAFTPYGLLTNARQLGALDTSEYLSFFTCPAVFLCAVLASLFALFGDRFFVHEMQRLAQLDFRRVILLRLAVAAAVASCFQPKFLWAALYLAIAGLSLMLHDALTESG